MALTHGLRRPVPIAMISSPLQNIAWLGTAMMKWPAAIVMPP